MFFKIFYLKTCKVHSQKMFLTMLVFPVNGDLLDLSIFLKKDSSNYINLKNYDPFLHLGFLFLSTLCSPIAYQHPVIPSSGPSLSSFLILASRLPPAVTLGSKLSTPPYPSPRLTPSPTPSLSLLCFSGPSSPLFWVLSLPLIHASFFHKFVPPPIPRLCATRPTSNRPAFTTSQHPC